MSLRRSAAAVALLIGLVGCGGQSQDGPATPATLIVGVSAQPDYLNPLVSNSAFATRLEDLLFLRLTQYGPPPDYDFVPALAESWELSEDGRTLTYQLRRDHRWHDGTPVTSRDVIFTFDRAADEAVPFPDRSKLRQLASWEAPDDHTVVFRFHEASWEPIFDTFVHIVPAHALEEVPPAEIQNHAFSRDPVGNGPWKFVEWRSEERVVLERNEAWPDGPAKFERVVFRVVPEETTLRAEFLTGRVHFYDRFPNKFYENDKDTPNTHFQRQSDRGYTYIGWNHKVPKFADPRVRRALTLATDRRAIIDAFRGGFGEVTASPLFLGHPDRHPDLEPLPYDPAAAAALLDEAGWTERDADGIRMKDGERFEFTYMLIAANEISDEIATLTQQAFADLGIGVSSEYYEWTVYLERLRQKNFEATVLARVGEMLFDPEDVFHSRSIPTRYNDLSFGHAVTDSLIDLAKSTLDRRARREIWWRFQEVFHDLQPITLLYVSEGAFPTRSDHVANPVMDLRGPFYRIAEWEPVH